MPIRDVEAYFPQSPKRIRFLANRGANGIDGVVSSAMGAAIATGLPTWVLIGELALQHDAGGLLAARRAGVDLQIVCIDNGGGGIFDFLPVATQGAAFEQHVATPLGLDFAHAASLYGLAYEPAAEPEALREALGRALAARGATLIHVRTDRGENVTLHRRVWEAVRAAV
jgi:2-succinyl-5-enolpyruvyl-6-hydroxy-3-cyclohexene-1-carboxylate synthase